MRIILHVPMLMICTMKCWPTVYIILKKIQMQRIIWKVCDWSENATYRIAETHYPEYNLVEFDLKQAAVVQVGES